MKRLHTGHVLVGLALLGLGLDIGLALRDALASRNSSGTMSAINGPYVAGTVISPATINARFADIETEVTDSLDRSGKGPMLAPLRLTNGTNALPSLTFDSDTDTGIYRVGADNPAVTVGGTKIQEWTSNGLRVANGAVATPSLSFINDTGSGLYRNGASDLRFAVAGADKTYWNATGFGVGLSPTFPIDVSYSNAAGGTAETALKLTNTQTANSTQIWFNGNRSWSIMAVGSAGAPAGGFSIVDNTASKTPFSINSSDAVIFGVGVSADGAGFKHNRSTTGCTTGASIGATCSSSVTWTTAFADANYTAICACNGVTSGVPVIGNVSTAASQLTVLTVATTASAAKCTNIMCIAAHD